MKNVLWFMCGATLGSLVTWKLVDEKYKRLAQKEIDEVREYYKGKKEEEPEEVNEYPHKTGVGPYPGKEERDMSYVEREEYSKVLTDLGYSKEDVDTLSEDPDISIELNEDGEYEVFVEPPTKAAPYVISPQEFGDQIGFDAENWTFYADGILTNDADQIVDEEEIGLYIGDGLDHFGDFEYDSVHIRNEGMKCDIEILKHDQGYDEAHGGDI